MTVLALDTSSGLLSVALAVSGRIVALERDGGARHSETLMAAVERCVSGSGHARADIDLIACARGPGSFTGLRIGMAAAKGLSLALGKPMVSVPTLDCAAFGREGASGPVVPVLDGRKGRVYAAVYVSGTRRSDWLDISVGELAGSLDAWPEVLFVGPDAVLMEEFCLERPGFSVDGTPWEGGAGPMALLAPAVLAASGPSPGDEGPLYLREPEVGASSLM